MSEIWLPDGWRWVTLGEVTEINPRRAPSIVADDNTPTTFVPMAAVDEYSGTMNLEIRPFSEVRKGYTYFEENDVVFAKITPCMQNGKHAVARNLINGFGFGTTEFHVIRPREFITATWIHLYIRQPAILELATTFFTGSVGQQRVPKEFLEALEIPLPPLAEQQRIAAAIEAQMAEIDAARAGIEAELEAAEALTASYLREVFESDEAGKPARLGDVLIRSTAIVHPHDNPAGAATFVGLEHIESGTGRRIGSLEVEMSELTGRKPIFYEGQLVYGYLRPYLNKVWIAEFDGLCSVDQYIYSVNADLALTEYIFWFMLSPAYMERSPVGSNTSQLPRIRLEEVAAVEFGLPSLDEQRQIVDDIQCVLEEINNTRAAVQERLQTINAMPAAVLRRAFSGEL